MSTPDIAKLVELARAAVYVIGKDQRPIENIGDWNHYQLARGVLDLVPKLHEALRQACDALETEGLEETAHRLRALDTEVR